MAKFKFYNGNLGFYGYGDFAAYILPAFTQNDLTLTFDTARADFDPTVHAAKITFYYTGVTSYVVEDGPDAGQTRVTGGTLTDVRYFNAAGDILLDITKLAIPLSIFLATLARGDGFTAWQMITHAPNGLFGSVDASGPGQAGTGDVIDTGVGADTVFGLTGDDFIKDQGGADDYNGASGFDTVAYDTWYFQPHWVLRGLDADLNLGRIIGPDGLTDTVTGIDAVTGTFRADLLKGNGFANKFSGMAGVDRIDGRGGFDMASYAMDAAQGGTDGIRANLAAGTVRDGFGYVDRIVSIEGIEGTRVHDVFVDSASNTYFDGGAGNDSFFFARGNDTGHGGPGADTFTFRGLAFDDDTIDDFSVSDGDKALFAAATQFDQLILTGVKVSGADAVHVQFGSGSVTLIGVALADVDAADFGF